MAAVASGAGDGAHDKRVAENYRRGVEATRGTLPPALLDRLETLVARLYLSADWRQAARARPLSRALETVRAAPLLLEALAVWDRRTRAGEGSNFTDGEYRLAGVTRPTASAIARTWCGAPPQQIPT